MGNVSTSVSLGGPCCQTSDCGNDGTVPAYACSPDYGGAPCPEDNCLEIRTVEYGAAIKTQDSFVMPACGIEATVIFPGVTSVHVGSYLWSANYGYLEITAFNPATQAILLRNNCNPSNILPGNNIPACVTFIVTAPPCDSLNSEVGYLTTNFIVPNIASCVTVLVTDTSFYQTGFTVQLGNSSYTVGTVINATSMEICNTGSALSPGSTVVALNPDGSYQYPIIITNSSSVFDSETFITGVTISTGNTDEETITSISYTNLSPNKTSQIFYTLSGVVQGEALNSNTSTETIELNIDEQVNGGGYVTRESERHSQYSGTNSAIDWSEQIEYSGVASVIPGQVFTLDARFEVTWIGAGGSSYVISNLQARIAGIVVVS